MYRRCHSLRRCSDVDAVYLVEVLLIDTSLQTLLLYIHRQLQQQALT